MVFLTQLYEGELFLTDELIVVYRKLVLNNVDFRFLLPVQKQAEHETEHKGSNDRKSEHGNGNYPHLLSQASSTHFIRCRRYIELRRMA